MKAIILVLVCATGSLVSTFAGPVIAPAITVSVETREANRSGVLIAVWPDGTIIWSGDQVHGGPPYRQGRTDAAKLAAFLVRLEKQGLLKKYADILETGPDSSYHLIRIVSGKTRASLGSWHEIFERNPKLVVTSRGVTSLGDKTREEELRNDDPAYREFRKHWQEIRTFTTKLIPPKGKPYREELKLDYPD